MNTSQTKPIRTRFAPSPTGFVHIGSLRTVLFNFLFTRHNQGTHILRIEDTDQNRLVAGAAENLLIVLGELGITFDEGPSLSADGSIIERGEYGPYVQSARKQTGLYKKYAEQLIESNHAYYCFCSEERLDELRKEQTALKKPPMYDRHCRNLSAEEIAKKTQELEAAGKTAVVRQVIPQDGQTHIHDLVYGDIVIENKNLDDQVLLKSDGFPTYHLAVVVDDHLMEITHVIRGPEWIASTPKHILLYQAFGWEPTEFAHIPLVLNEDKSKLSKRQGDVAVEDFLKKGYLKEALLNFIAFLGWNPKSEQEIFSLDELINQFDLANVNKAGAVFDLDKLDWMNGMYIRSKSLTDLSAALIPYWESSGFIKKSGDGFTTQSGIEISTGYLEAIAKLEQERLKKLSEIGERTAYFFTGPKYSPEMIIWKKSNAQETTKVLQELVRLFSMLKPEDFDREVIEIKIKEFIQNNNFDNGTVLWPLRASLTGMSASPGPFDVISVLVKGLGQDVVIKRLKYAISLLEKQS